MSSPELEGFRTVTVSRRLVHSIALAIGLVGVNAPLARATHCEGDWSSHTSVSDATCAASDGTTIWFGTLFGGVHEWDTVTKTGRVYTVNEHCLPSNFIEDITVDTAGNVWAATTRGLARRPAANSPVDPWETFDTSNSGLTDNLIMAVAAEPAGGVWVGTFDGGLFFFDGMTWSNYNTSNSPLGDNFVTSLAVDLAGNKWIGTFGNFAYRFDGVSTWTHFDLDATNSPGGCFIAGMPPEDLGFISTFVKVLGVDPITGHVWFDNIDDGFCNLNGTTRFDGTNWVTFTPSNSAIHFRTESIGVTATGDTWLASLNGVQRFDGGAFTAFSEPESARTVTAVGASVWFGTTSGPGDLTGGVFTSYSLPTLASPLANDIVFRDLGEGDVEAWIASSGSLQRYDGESWSALTPENSPLSTFDISALAVDLDNSLWIGPSPSGAAVQHLVNDVWTSYTPENSGLLTTDISAIAVDPTSGLKWFGYRFSSGVATFDGTTWQSFASNGSPFGCNAMNGVPGRPIAAIAADGDGTTWIGSGCGLTRVAGGVWTTFDMDDGLVSNNINDLALDADGNVWIATFGGVSMFDGNSFLSWFADRDVSTVAIDHNGIVWATLTDIGVAAYDGTGWQMLTVADGLLDFRTPESTAIHPNGNVWFGTQIGLSIYNQATPIMFGDIDFDGDVDVADAAALAAVLVDNPASAGHALRADLDFNGVANGQDIPLFLDVLLPPD